MQSTVAARLLPVPELYTPEVLSTRPFHKGLAFAIDPPGTIEADDAIFATIKPGTDGLEADVSVLISDGALLSAWPDAVALAARNRCTRYRENGRHKYMLPREGIEQLSLAQDVPGGVPVLSVNFEVSYFGVSLRGVERARAFVAPMSYGEFVERVQDGDPMARTIARVGKILNGKHATVHKEYGVGSAKHAVAAYMVAANRLLSAYTSQRDIQVIHRHFGNMPDIPPEAQNAIYDTVALPHQGLLVDRYGHWTSPQRRFSDLYNHLALSGELNIEGLNHSRIIGHLNERAYSRRRDDARSLQAA